VTDLDESRRRVLERIADAARRAGRDPADITLVAVTKTVPLEGARAAVAAGLTNLGENRVQEAEEKIGRVEGATWHLIGPLQSNKARRAVKAFDMIQSVDSTDLARRLDRLAAEIRPSGRLPTLLQVNVDDDEAKAGFSSAGLERDRATILDLPHLEVRGLMTIGRLVERAVDARSTFVGLRELGRRLRSVDPRLGEDLSMGMSDDYEVAIEEGATIVRVGRALFGERHEHG
jgi:pyridoxal phosphate enzyme (YggS family)